MEIAICDDDEKVLTPMKNSLTKLLQANIENMKYTLYTSGKQLLEDMKKEQSFDLIFLDIELRGENGIDIGKQIYDEFQDTLLIFISAHDQFIFDIFKAHPFYFIRKHQFKKDIGKLKELLLEELAKQDKDKLLKIQLSNEVIQMPIKEILYIQAQDKYLNIITTTKNMLIRYKISDLEEQVTNLGFIRIHKSYLINASHIYLLKNTTVVLDNNEQLPISRHRLNQVKENFKDWMS